MYHAVLPLPARAERDLDRTLIVDPGELAWQLDELRRCGYQTLTLDDYFAALDQPDTDSRGVLLTFDDGYAHLSETVSPLLEASGFSAVLFVPTAYLGGGNSWDNRGHPLHAEPVAAALTLTQMAQGPWEIASHGVRHVDLRALPPEEQVRTLRTARERLGEITGRPVYDLAYPYGLSDASVRDAARAAGYRMAFAATAELTSDRFRLPRVVVRGQEGRKAFRIRIEPGFRSLFG
ncbi:MAG: polysaccharide deacetylase family protein [Actinomycetes bacterium]